MRSSWRPTAVIAAFLVVVVGLAIGCDLLLCETAAGAELWSMRFGAATLVFAGVLSIVLSISALSFCGVVYLRFRLRHPRRKDMARKGLDA